MPAERASPNTLGPAVRVRSVTAGDVPEALGRRYFTDTRGGAGLGFYVDARVQTPAFRDRGGRLVAARADPNAIRDMLAIAQHRGWTAVTVRGATDFRREAWLAGRVAGLEVGGYPPTTRDLQELERRQRGARRTPRADVEQRKPPEQRGQERPATARETMRVVEAVVRSRLTEPSTRERILAGARQRLARWLEQGAQVYPPPRAPSAEIEGVRRRERTH